MLEVIDTIMGHSLSSFDANHTFINTNEDDQRTRKLLPKKDVQVGV